MCFPVNHTDGAWPGHWNAGLALLPTVHSSNIAAITTINQCTLQVHCTPKHHAPTCCKLPAIKHFPLPQSLVYSLFAAFLNFPMPHTWHQLLWQREHKWVKQTPSHWTWANRFWQAMTEANWVCFLRQFQYNFFFFLCLLEIILRGFMFGWPSIGNSCDLKLESQPAPDVPGTLSLGAGYGSHLQFLGANLECLWWILLNSE